MSDQTCQLGLIEVLKKMPPEMSVKFTTSRPGHLHVYIHKELPGGQGCTLRATIRSRDDKHLISDLNHWIESLSGKDYDKPIRLAGGTPDGNGGQ